MDIVANRIKERRKALRLSRLELAERVGVKDETIGSYERGTRTPRHAILSKIAKALNVTTDFLLGNTDDNKGEKNIAVEGKKDSNTTVIIINGNLESDKINELIKFLNSNGKS